MGCDSAHWVTRQEVNDVGTPTKNQEGVIAMKTKSSSGIKVKAGVKAGGMWTINHSHSGLKVRTGIKAAGGGIWQNNHSPRLLVTA